jgi:hypothetical protein
MEYGCESCGILAQRENEVVTNCLQTGLQTCDKAMLYFFRQLGRENILRPCSDVAVEDIEGQAVDIDLCNQLPAELAHLPRPVLQGEKTAN